MKNIGLGLKTLALSCLVLIGVAGFAPQPALAAVGAVSPQSEACDAIGSGTDCKSAQGLKVDSIITRVIDLLSVIIGIVAVVMIIIAGFKYVTSAGDSNKVTSAKNTIVYAIVGLIIVALAQVIVKFVINSSTGKTKTSYSHQIESNV